MSFQRINTFWFHDQRLEHFSWPFHIWGCESVVKWEGGVFCLLLKLGPTWPTLTSRPTLQKRSTTHLAGRGFHKKEYKVGTPGKTLHLKGPLTWHRWGYSLFPEYMIWRFDLSITWPNFECFHPGGGADNGFLLLQIPWDCGSTALPPFLHFPPSSSPQNQGDLSTPLPRSSFPSEKNAGDRKKQGGFKSAETLKLTFF